MTWKKNTSESSALLRYEQVEQDSEIEDGFESPADLAEAEVDSDSPEGTSHWRSISASVTLLCFAFVAVAFYPRSSHFELAATADLLDEWAQIPNISRVITRAQGLQPGAPVRNLRDLFVTYQPYPEQILPFVRTACVIDAVQATAYLGHAVVWLYRAIDYNGLECPENTPAGCAISVAGFVASISWVASYLSLAASACSDTVNSGALCAADWTALVADMSEIASSGAGVKRNCDFGGRLTGLLKIHHPPKPYYERLVAAAQGPAKTILEITKKEHADQERAMDITMCVMDVTNAASFLVRATLQIGAATVACPDPKACTIDILEVISSFSWISRFVSMAVSDCSKRGNMKARCGADISNLVAAVANGPAAGIATTSDCADHPEPAYELLHEPTAR